MAMAPPKQVRTTALVLANLLLPVAVLVFASGFFPYKPFLPGLATFGDADAARRQPDAPFKRVVFMVVDALRSDFVYGYDSGFEYTQSLIRAGAAIPFTAHATPPTVTMPRVKALTTGSVPSFLDLILNFAESDTTSSLATQDTWLAQLRAAGRPLVFYGDDTWLKLFPGDFFARHDGTSSFFVSDFTEVDYNVTRHLPDELGREDWSALIMHYLGLDHIGHKTGPQGPNMLPKQREMDEVVRMIFEAMEEEAHHRDTLLVLAGDHGMNAGGNHGGSGPGETEPALLFASPKFKSMRSRKEYQCPTGPREGTEFHYYTKVEQSDLVPTLAGMMGFPVSRNSLGVHIEELTGFWDGPGVLQLLEQNARQMLAIIQAAYGQEAFRQAVSKSTDKPCGDVDEGEQRLACLWARAEGISSTEQSRRDALNAILHEAQDTMSGTASSYNIPNMVVGIALSAAIVALALFSFPSLWPPSTASLFFATASILYGVMMFASSYVEEEQHFWYWLTPAWIALLSIRSAAQSAGSKSLGRLTFATFSLLAINRFATRWNQTGQKHAGASDIVHTFFPEANVFMWVLILGTYVYNGYALVATSFAGILSTEISLLLAVALILPAIVFKLNFTQADAPELVNGLAERIRTWTAPFDLVTQARIAFLILAIASTVVVVLSVASHRASAKDTRFSGILPSLSERLHHLLTLFLMTQTRAPNIPLFVGLEIQLQALSSLLESPSSSPGARQKGAVTIIATSTLLLSHVYFFSMGGSNSISSIDLSNAYNGVSGYNIVAVGVLLFASNWTGPIWWCSAANLLLTQRATPPGFQRSLNKNDSRAWIDDERIKLRQDTLDAVRGAAKAEAAIDSVSERWRTYVACMTGFVGTSLLAVIAACTALRTHLFIWTVFSPKFLYAMAWSVGWHLIVNIGLGSLLSWLSGFT